MEALAPNYSALVDDLRQCVFDESIPDEIREFVGQKLIKYLTQGGDIK
jgi:hypothetical protein